MTIHENRAIAYFGLMHTIATNMCIWLYVIIEETKHDVISAHDESDSSLCKFQFTRLACHLRPVENSN
jgi:Otopetrin